ncbi:MAG: sigma-54-dependent Fis family transcriptional regulator [Nitrospinae bacterium]|nr:sigma-54-dependent Fis family transcriptional regulator [Nitrospinota bacterium]
MTPDKVYPYPILVVDDEPAILDVMRVNLERKNYTVHTAQTGREALSHTNENSYALFIIDYSLPDMNGFQLMAELRRKDADAIVMMITAHGTIEMAVEAMRAGAFNYLAKPINYDEMALLVEKAAGHHRLLTELWRTKAELDEKFEMDNIVGQSKKMLKVYEKVRVVAESDATVLIRGETGTGKELIARAIHRHSQRRNRNFIRMNCAAIPESLLEAELFGHERGAFTGAIQQRKGKFEASNGGTIYLDEIGEISMAVQAKLLRVLQEGEFDRMGGNDTITVDTRVITTTNRNLEEAIREGTFRLDLFYRLNVIPIYLPSLRERKEDIPLLVHHFIKKFAKKNNKEITSISPAAMAAITQYDWPGNVRELENIIERAVVLAAKDRLDKIEIPGMPGNNGKALHITGQEAGFQSAKKKVIESFETHYLSHVLKKHRGNISAAAKEAGLDYKNFHNKLKKYHLKKSQFEG